MRVTVSVEEAELEGDYGTVNGITVTCSRCGYSVDVYGTEERSIRRGCVTLRNECPSGESNYYEE